MHLLLAMMHLLLAMMHLLLAMIRLGSTPVGTPDARVRIRSGAVSNPGCTLTFSGAT
jgi:hypothetical protein